MEPKRRRPGRNHDRIAYRSLVAATVCAAVLGKPTGLLTAADVPTVAFNLGGEELAVQIGGRTVARYVFRDAEIPRPYFCDVVAPNGVQVTRRHPPREGVDRTDHRAFPRGI